MTTSQRAHAVQANVTEEAVVINATSEHTIAFDALLVERALRVRCAGGDAAALEAPVPASALQVALTGDRNADALAFRGSSETGRTRADRLVVFHAAFGVHPARFVQRARIQALAPHARLRVLAFGVRLTSWFADAVVAERVGRAVRLGLAPDRDFDASGHLVCGVSFVALATLAGGLVIGRKAVGVRSAGEAGADVLALRLAFFSRANGRRRAVLIFSALDRLLAALPERLADHSRRTSAFVRSSRVLAPGAGGTRRLRAVIDWSARGFRVAGVTRLTLAH